LKTISFYPCSGSHWAGAIKPKGGTMRRYETIFILDPDVSEEQRGSVFGRLSDLMGQKAGLQVTLDEWGAKKLAYEIRKKHRGYYVRLDYCGGGDLVDEIERFFRIDDRILKYMTIVLNKDVDIEAVKQEMADAAAKQEAAATMAAEAAAAAEKETALETAPEPDTKSTPEPDTESTPEMAENEGDTIETDQEKEEA
jgi:small subunit ribosomal protein S6